MAQTASPEVLERFKEGFEWWNYGELIVRVQLFPTIQAAVEASEG